MAKYRCRLQQLGAPPWACAAAAALLCILLIANAAMITTLVWGSSVVPAWLLPTIWITSVVGVLVLVRRLRASASSLNTTDKVNAK